MYYFLTQDLDDDDYMVFGGPSENSSKRLWGNGKTFEEDYPIDTFYIRPSSFQGIKMPDFFDSSTPIMSNRMLNKIKSLGVDNIESYAVIIQQENSNAKWDNYSVINLIGKSDIIDRVNSDIDEFDRFHSVVINEYKANNVLCTRLYNGPFELLIHESIANELLKEGFSCVKIIKSEDYDADD